ncbi:MAG: hypothetical protein AAF730_09460 [Bacteroidota bacterium]
MTHPISRSALIALLCLACLGVSCSSTKWTCLCTSKDAQRIVSADQYDLSREHAESACANAQERQPETCCELRRR